MVFSSYIFAGVLTGENISTVRTYVVFVRRLSATIGQRFLSAVKQTIFTVYSYTILRIDSIKTLALKWSLNRVCIFCSFDDIGVRHMITSDDWSTLLYRYVYFSKANYLSCTAPVGGLPLSQI